MCQISAGKDDGDLLVALERQRRANTLRSWRLIRLIHLKKYIVKKAYLDGQSEFACAFFNDFLGDFVAGTCDFVNDWRQSSDSIVGCSIIGPRDDIHGRIKIEMLENGLSEGSRGSSSVLKKMKTQLRQWREDN